MEQTGDAMVGTPVAVLSEGGSVAVTAEQVVSMVAPVATGELAEAMAGAWHARHNQRSQIHMSTRRSPIQARRRRRSHRPRTDNQTWR